MAAEHEGSQQGIERRTVIGGGLLVAGAALLSGLRDAPAADAATGDPLVLGRPNSADDATHLTRTRSPSGAKGGVFGLSITVGDPNSPLLESGHQAGVLGLSSALSVDPNDPEPTGGHSVGVFGASNVAGDPNQPLAVPGQSVGVLGLTQLPVDPNDSGRDAGHVGVFGITSFSGDPNQPGISPGHPVGVFGYSRVSAQDPNDPAADHGHAAGVQGVSPAGVGVFGTTGSAAWDPNDANPAAGVYGLGRSPGVPGVIARNAQGGVALSVKGRTILSSAGSGTVPRGAAQQQIAHPAVSRTSVVLVTLTGDPGAAVLKWVRVAGGAFTVVLAGRAPRAIPFRFVVLN